MGKIECIGMCACAIVFGYLFLALAWTVFVVMPPVGMVVMFLAWAAHGKK